MVQEARDQLMSVGKISVGVTALILGIGLSANAQGIVPGGWAPQFGYQLLGTPGVSGGFAFGYSMPGYGAGVYGGSGFGMNSTGFAAIPYGVNYGFNTTSGRAANGVDPLINAIHQTTRRPRRGR
jgi:hypothetical protein